VCSVLLYEAFNATVVKSAYPSPFVLLLSKSEKKVIEDQSGFRKRAQLPVGKEC